MTQIEKYNQINPLLNQVITKRNQNLKPVIDTSLPLLRDSKFIQYIATAFFGYKRMPNNGVDIDPKIKTDLMEQFQNQIKSFKSELVTCDNQLKVYKSEEKKLNAQLKGLTKEEDEKAQEILTQIQNNASAITYTQNHKAKIDQLIKHYLNKLAKLRNNDKKLIEYIADSIFIRNLIQNTYSSLDNSAQLVELAKEDISKVDAIASEKNISYALALFSQICFNKQYRDIISQLEEYNQGLGTFIGLEILADFMEDKITLEEANSDSYWQLPEITDILNPEEVKAYMDAVQAKYDKVYKFYMSKPAFFKKNDMTHIRSILKFVYNVVLSPGATLVMAQSLENVKSAPIDNASKVIYQRIYDNLLPVLKNKLFPDYDNPQDDFFRKYMLLILLSTTTPEDLTARLEVM